MANAEGLKRDFQSLTRTANVGRRRWFKSRTRDRLQANRALAFRFEVIAQDRLYARVPAKLENVHSG